MVARQDGRRGPRAAAPDVGVQEQAGAPLLQAHPTVEVEDYEAKQQQALNTFGWIDKTTDTVRLPIQHAMKLVVEEGLPTRRGGR